MKQIASLAFVATLAITLLAGSAHAQFFYSPPPPLMGQPSYHLYSVPGVISDVGTIGTFFACSNTTDSSIRVGVEVFGPPGGSASNDPSGSSLELGPGASVIFVTQAAAGFNVNSILGSSGSKGLARILATKSKGIICTAFLADRLNSPPTSMADLTIVAKTKQKGD
jgi:hypothetical protein